MNGEKKVNEYFSLTSQNRVAKSAAATSEPPITRIRLAHEVANRMPTDARDRGFLIKGGRIVMDYEQLAARLSIPQFRPKQIECIQAIADKRDVLHVSPTGSGKTEAFLGSGLVMGGISLIVSPLRSLIADMQRRLNKLSLTCWTWNSDVSDGCKLKCLDWLNDPNSEGFLITTPESLKGKELSFACADHIRLAIVDEAHCCLKERGFRVSYAWLGAILGRVRPKQLYACTATLASSDREHLINALGLASPKIIISPVARSNIELRIHDRGLDSLVSILRHHKDQCGIIFCATVSNSERLYGSLKNAGWSVGNYHGRLAAKTKKEAQERFMAGHDKAAIVTDAFLLGIDKPDIRFCVHYDHPKSIEDWVQGFGRLGRDGNPSTAYGFFQGESQGLNSRRFLLQASYPDLDTLRAVDAYLRRVPYCSKTASAIGEGALGRDGKYTGSACITTLTRHHLVNNKVNPDDRRKRIYQATGNFEAVNWKPYLAERAETFNRFRKFCDLVRQPEALIPQGIDEYLA